MLFVTVSVLQLREVVHPDLLSLVIRPQEPHPDLLGSLLQESGITLRRGRGYNSLGDSTSARPDRPALGTAPVHAGTAPVHAQNKRYILLLYVRVDSLIFPRQVEGGKASARFHTTKLSGVHFRFLPLPLKIGKAFAVRGGGGHADSRIPEV